MRQFHEKSDDKEIKTEPGPLIKSTLISNSLFNDFDEAKAEWELVGNIPSESYDFVENCELCNRRNYIENWVVFNPNTKKTLKVGSECIKRFIILNGARTQEDSNTFFELKERELKKEYTLRELYKAVVVEVLPLARKVNRFRGLLIQLLDDRGQRHLTNDEKGILYIIKETLKVKNPSDKEVKNLYSIIHEPEKVLVQRETRKFREWKRIKEGQTWNKQGKVTYTTLSQSEAYKPDGKYR